MSSCSKLEKTCFCATLKGQKEKKHASARCRKVKKSKNTLLHDAERPKREKTHFCEALDDMLSSNIAGLPACLAIVY